MPLDLFSKTPLPQTLPDDIWAHNYGIDFSDNAHGFH
jgi:hypothetical protein